MASLQFICRRWSALGPSSGSIVLDIIVSETTRPPTTRGLMPRGISILFFALQRQNGNSCRAERTDRRPHGLGVYTPTVCCVPERGQIQHDRQDVFLCSLPARRTSVTTDHELIVHRSQSIRKHMGSSIPAHVMAVQLVPIFERM